MSVVEISDFVVERLEWEEVKAIYPQVYSSVFSKSDTTQAPAFVYIGRYKGDFVGFFSAYLQKTNTVYLQYGGFTKGYRGFLSPRLCKLAIEAINREYMFIIIHINNMNVPAIKLALYSGFFIIGTHVSTDKTLYVEFIRGGNYGGD